MRDYHNITAFAKIDDLAISVYEITREWPKDELYGLVSQIRRAAVSAAANIVEGSGRRHKNEYLKFLSVSNGSLREVGYYLHLAYRLGYLSEEQYNKIEKEHGEASRVLWGLLQAVADEQGQNPEAK
ncbi:MAG: four helix bundle protein [Armatimonadota bacterium]